MSEEIKLKEVFPVQPSEIYTAWLNSELHSEMTGGVAECSDEVDGHFTAWDGYISGKNVELIESQEIVQTWRTSEFNERDESSMLKIELNKIPEGTEMILTHTNIPAGQTQYEEGWVDHYLSPMKSFFK